MIRATTILLLLTIASAAWAESADEKGFRIAQEAHEDSRGFQSSSNMGEMILRDRSGKESTRRYQSRALEVPGDADKTMIVFEWPRDIDGLGLLTHAHKTRDDDQWLYLPSNKRVKRISSGGRTGSFAGSEFSYEDLAGTYYERFDYTWLRDEACPDGSGRLCWVIERRPHDRESGYSRQVIWMVQDNYTVPQTFFFDRKNTHIKTMVSNGYKLYDGKFWRADSITMTNLRNGRSSTMKASDFKFSAGLLDRDFTRRALENAGR